jgi:aspartyl-tRNA(Asn)/glutamyl-tRNA(Gln) amidotransferase subunit A
MRSSAGDWSFLPAHVLSIEIGTRRVSPVDLFDVLLERIRAMDPKLHAFVEVYAEDARLAAEAADKAIRSGHAIGPLHGIPIALKDLIEIKGKVTTGGSLVWRDRQSRCTATLARRLIAAGLIVLGKTHTVEFAMGGWGTNHALPAGGSHGAGGG